MKISNNNKVNFKYDLIYVLNVCGNNLCLKLNSTHFLFKKHCISLFLDLKLALIFLLNL